MGPPSARPAGAMPAMTAGPPRITCQAKSKARFCWSAGIAGSKAGLTSEIHPRPTCSARRCRSGCRWLHQQPHMSKRCAQRRRLSGPLSRLLHTAWLASGGARGGVWVGDASHLKRMANAMANALGQALFRLLAHSLRLNLCEFVLKFFALSLLPHPSCSHPWGFSVTIVTVPLAILVLAIAAILASVSAARL
jgi:hypothetical protein